MAYSSNIHTEKSGSRIIVADCLRGFAVCGIIMIHFLEHLNFWDFSQVTITPFDQGLFDTVFFLGSNKMYAIFALLFGFSCYVQHHNQEIKGRDFRGRFVWRMILLFLWGMVDLLFYNGDILCTYAVLGILLVPLVKAPDKVLYVVAAVFFLQPVELAYSVAGLADPTLSPLNLGSDAAWPMILPECASGSILDVAVVGHRYGLPVNFTWAIENGRLTQTYLLFVVGLIIGRKQLLLDGAGNLAFWKKVCIGSIIAFVPFQLLVSFVPGQIANTTVSSSLMIMFKAWRNFSMTAFYVSGIILLFYCTKWKNALMHFSYFGKMSLSCYLIQSIAGGFLFYNWGLGMFRYSPHSTSLLLSIFFLVILYVFCRFWITRHRRGPLEEVWNRATWIGGRK